MVILLSKINADKFEQLAKWNASTFNIRKSYGLIAVRPYKVSSEVDEYYSLSYWDNKESLESFLNSESLQQLLNTKAVEWLKILESVDQFNEGNLPAENIEKV